MCWTHARNVNSNVSTHTSTYCWWFKLIKSHAFYYTRYIQYTFSTCCSRVNKSNRLDITLIYILRIRIVNTATLSKTNEVWNCCWTWHQNTLCLICWVCDVYVCDFLMSLSSVYFFSVVCATFDVFSNIHSKTYACLMRRLYHLYRKWVFSSPFFSLFPFSLGFVCERVPIGPIKSMGYEILNNIQIFIQWYTIDKSV